MGQKINIKKTPRQIDETVITGMIQDRIKRFGELANNAKTQKEHFAAASAGMAMIDLLYSIQSYYKI